MNMGQNDSINNGLIVLENRMLTVEDIKKRIFTIRGVQVMLDRDLAALYGVETKYLNKQVKRNIERFPEDFMFQLTKEEASRFQNGTLDMSEEARSQNGTLKGGRGSNIKYLPYAFTEQGISQLSGVLRGQMAIDASILIMRAFVAMRRFISANAGLFQRMDLLESRQTETERKLDVVLDKIEELSPAPTTEQLFGTGCVWDAYTFVCDLVRSAEMRLVLVDNFVDERTLLILDKRTAGVTAEVYTRYSEQVRLDFEKHNKQCEEIQYVQLPHQVHDRYLVVDDVVWLLGSSVKDMGHGLCTIIKTGIKPEMILQLIKGN